MSRLDLTLCLPVLLFLFVHADAEEKTKPLAVWDSTVAVDGGVGYRDNVLRSSIAKENSGFVQLLADASVMRLSETDALLLFYLFGDRIQYFDAPTVNYEEIISGTAQWIQPVGNRNEFGLQATYLYQHQIMDASATEAFLRRILVLGHGLEVNPAWTYKMDKGWEVELEGVAIRQVYEHFLDDFWEGGGQVYLRRAYGNRSEAELSLGSTLRSYDTRLQYDESGVPMPDTELAYWQAEAGGRWRHYWDAERHWRTLTTLDYMLNRDNGTGYFDYDRLLFRQQVRWRRDPWEVKANLRLGHYFHKLQVIDGEGRYRSYAMLDAGAERWFWKHWKVYANAEYEWSTSNDPRDKYTSWMASTGIGLEF